MDYCWVSKGAATTEWLFQIVTKSLSLMYSFAWLSSALVLTDNWERCHAALDIDTDNIIAADNNDQDNNEDNDDINLTPDDLVLFSGSTKIGWLLIYHRHHAAAWIKLTLVDFPN